MELNEESESQQQQPRTYEDPHRNRMASVPVEDPVFPEAGPQTDVVARCPNGKIKGRSTAAIFVVMRINVEGVDTDADVMCYSHETQFAGRFMEYIAARDCFGQDWNPKHGSAVWSPYRDDGSDRPVPPGRFMMWDEQEEDIDGVPPPTVCSLTIYDSAPEGYVEGDARTPIRRYKLVSTNITIHDYMAIETAGDTKFIK